jgi:hypothetical protein
MKGSPLAINSLKIFNYFKVIAYFYNFVGGLQITTYVGSNN